jgi:hypothetical protein
MSIYESGTERQEDEVVLELSHVSRRLGICDARHVCALRMPTTRHPTVSKNESLLQSTYK